jgi:hypothetical protein
VEVGGQIEIGGERRELARKVAIHAGGGPICAR